MKISTRADILALFDRRGVAWDARDAEALAATHAPDGTVKSPMFVELH